MSDNAWSPPSWSSVRTSETLASDVCSRDRRRRRPLGSFSDRHGCRIGWRGWVPCVQPQLPFQKLHMLTEPPAGGTEAKVVHGASAVLYGPVDRRLHWSPHTRDDGSRNSTASYSVTARTLMCVPHCIAINETKQHENGVRRRREQNLAEQPAPPWPYRRSKPTHGGHIERARAGTALALPSDAQPRPSPRQH